MTRYQYIEKELRLIYGTQPIDDADITFNLVNIWLSEGIGIAAQKNYRDNGQLEGINFVNNGFYTTFKNLPVTKFQNFLYRVELPEIPVGIGHNEGVSTLTFTDTTTGFISYPSVPLTINQATYYRSMRPVQNKLLYIQQGKFLDVVSTLILSVGYTANVVMISGGDSTDLNSVLNVPPDYLPIIDEFIEKKLMAERLVPQDDINDGNDNVTTK